VSTTSPDLHLALTTRLEAYVDLLRDPEAGEALWDAYADDALLFFRGEVLLKPAVARAEFGWVMGATARQRRKHHDEPLRPALGAPVVLAIADEGPQALVWFRAPEVVAGEDLVGCVGFVRVGGQWLVKFATSAAEPQPWDFAAALSHALADAPMVASAQLGSLRGWLDASYYRRKLLPRPALKLLPEARFGCHGSLRCCDIGFRIDLDPSARAVIDAIQWDPADGDPPDTNIPRRADGKLALKAQDEPCRFLDAQRLCRVHKALGRQPFSVCSAYPVYFTETPGEEVVVAISMACPSARAGLGPPLSDRLDDLYERLAQSPAAPAPAALKLAPDAPVAWAAYEGLEAELLEILARTDLNLIDRLWEGERRLHAALGWPALPADRPQAAQADQVFRGRRLVARTRAYLSGGKEPPGLIPAEGPAGPVAELASMLRMYHFAKRAAYKDDLLTSWRVGMIFALTALLMLDQAEDGQLPGPLVWSAGSMLFHTPVFDFVTATPAEAEALRALCGSPAFGAELLALAAGDPAVPASGWRYAAEADRDALWAMLAARPQACMPLLDALANAQARGIDVARLGWFARWEGGEPKAVVSTQGNLWAWSSGPAWDDEVAAVLRDFVPEKPWVLGAAPIIDRVVAARGPELPPTKSQTMHVQVLDAANLVARPADPAVRAATDADLLAVALNEAALLREDVGYDPIAVNPEGFLGAITRRIASGRVFVLAEEGEIRYQVSLGYCAPALGVAELLNPYVPRAYRDQGLPERALPDICRLALAAFPQLLLTVQEDEQALLALARGCGFREAGVVIEEVMWHERAPEPEAEPPAAPTPA